MAMKQMERGGNLDVFGTREYGQDVRTQNITAVSAVANIVKSSLGPVGLDKMLVDSIGDVTITNDGATILKQLEVEHPAAKILVELSEMQDQAVGDGTTSVVILASELLKHANNLVRQSLHPTTIISGYRLASKEACKYLKENLSQKTENLGRDTLLNAAKTSMSSKIIGVDSDYFANMLIDAMLSVKSYNDMGDVKYPVKAINILKAHGKSAKESEVLNGYAINVGRAAQGMVKAVQNAKIACLDMNLQKSRMQMGIQVLVSDPKELEKIREEESNITKKRIEKILAAGANVIFTTKGIDDMSLKYFVEAGAIACRRIPKEDLRRIAKCTGATVVSTLADMEGEETFDASNLGQAESVAEERVCDDDIIMVKGAKSTASVTLLLRGANDYMLDEMERSIHDALCVVKRTLEYGSVVAGGGAVEAALSVFLENFAISLGSREQLPVAEFADALMVIPKTLAVNAAKDAIDLVAKLRAYHYTSQMKSGKEKFAEYGLDLYEGAVVNNIEKGVIEPALSKIKILQFATEAAITILRIDDLVQLEKDPSEQQG
eukprot:CAMPEP_0197472978 /NCGR_PEP_ID=MMETSP1309-20131121/4253_1 /TAXON_ID=464262 /ORGANISM="Genus nov. species nov., Strain RCC998" /LENGTH=549 /DNA_ID=CAMNT_0043011851 /DNA_START=296 /DNA_END=1945 /DNA_ORIENTATION=-